jgi:hypothetical protein
MVESGNHTRKLETLLHPQSNNATIMALVALPAELKLNIAESLDPDSALNSALTCKDHAALFKPLLREHARLFSDWQVLDTENARTLTWQTLKKVLADPSKD